MSAQTRVTDQKFYAQFNNGDTFALNASDYATHLKGGVLEDLKAVFTVEIDWTTIVSTYSLLYSTANDTLRLTDNTINWNAEGFAVGDTLKISIPDGTLAPGPTKIRATVTAITGGELDMETISFPTGTPLADGVTNFSLEDSYVTGLTSLTALKYKFGLIENAESFNVLSKLTNTEQVYLYENIDHGSPGTFVNGVSGGNNKAWVTGTSKVTFLSLVTDRDLVINESTSQEFQIVHEFSINPFYRDGELNSLLGTSNPPIDIYNGNKSLKYVFETEFREVLSNPNTAKIAQYDSQLGSVGYFNQSFNGYANQYSVSNLLYTDVPTTTGVSKIDVLSTTRVSFTLNSANATFSELDLPVLIVGHAAVMDSTKYAINSSEFNEVWLNENLRTTAGSGAIADNIISNYTVTIGSPSTINVIFDVSFSAAEQLLLSNNQDYILYYTIQDITKNVNNGDKVTDLITVDCYDKSNDITGLFQVDKLEQYPHPETFTIGVTTGYTSGKMFLEDGQMLDCRFKLKDTYLDPETASNLPVTLSSLKFKIVAYDTVSNDWFDLREFNLDISNQVIVGNVQNITLNTTRGYVLDSQDIFNSVIIATDTHDGTYQFYNMQIGYKIPWQDWIELIGADTVFYDNTKLHNGLNNKSSNYSFANNYKIRFLIEAVVNSNNTDSTYVTTSGDFEAYDYETDDESPDGFTAVIQTFDSIGADLSGNIINGGYTEVRATFNPSSVDPLNAANYYGIIRIEEVNSPTDFGISEISTMIEAPNNSRLKQFSGSLRKADIAVVGTNYVVKCLVDTSLTQLGTTYKISAEIRHKTLDS